jgi:hypothetical protein
MAPVCFRTCHVRRFLDDIYTSAAAYNGKKEKSCSKFGATEARKQTVKKIGRDDTNNTNKKRKQTGKQ